MALNINQILAADDLETREVHVPEWADPETGDDVVFVKALSGAERDAYEGSLRSIRGSTVIPNLANARAKLVARALVDENGQRIFTDKQIDQLGSKSAAVLERLFDVAAEMSGLNDEDVEQMVGNSEADSPDDSTSN